MIFGIMGGCSSQALHDLRVENVQDTSQIIIVNVIETRQPRTQRTFIITGNYYNICKQYMNLRPKNCSSQNFFLNYQHGKCTTQNIGKNKFGNMGRQIATYLQLPDVNLYTGHCFRRMSGSVLVDGGGDNTILNRHGRWKSM